MATQRGSLGPGAKGSGNNSSITKYRNGDTLALPLGVPVIFAAGLGTYEDCFSVLLPSTANTNNSNTNGMVAGITVGPPTTGGVPKGAVVDVADSGLVPSAKLLISTRAASGANFTDGWVAHNAGDVCGVDVTNNALKRVAGGGSAQSPAMFQLAFSLASGASVSSNFSSAGFFTTATGLFVYGKVFVRTM